MGRKTAYVQVVTPQLLEQVNKENKSLKRDFLAYLKATDRSQTTISSYGSDLDLISVYILQSCDNKSFLKFTKRDMISFQNYLIDKGNSPARIRRLRAVLSSLSNYIENILEEPNYKNPIKGIDAPVNVPVREKTVLSEKQIHVILDYLVEHKRYQKACLFALAACSGRRKSELVRFKVSYFDDSCLEFDGAMYKTPEQVRSKGRGKNGKLLDFYTLAKPFKPYFDMWIKEREEKGINSEWLFVDNNGDQLDKTTLNSWFTSFGKIIGEDIYPHAMRHWMVTYMHEAGLPDGVIQHIIGWASIDLVGVYTDTDKDDELAKYFQGGSIKGESEAKIQDL